MARSTALPSARLLLLLDLLGVADPRDQRLRRVLKQQFDGS
jgi:hypothetical protein